MILQAASSTGVTTCGKVQTNTTLVRLPDGNDDLVRTAARRKQVKFRPDQQSLVVPRATELRTYSPCDLTAKLSDRSENPHQL